LNILPLVKKNKLPVSNVYANFHSSAQIFHDSYAMLFHTVEVFCTKKKNGW